MSMIKRAALEAFAAAFRAALPPSLGITVEVAAADWEEPQTFPILRLVPADKFNFEQFQEEEIDDTQPDRLLLEVGDFDGSVELRAGGRNKKEREAVEDAVLNVLFSREGAAGVFVAQTENVTVGGFATLYSAPVTLCMSSEEWREEMVFARKRFSFLVCDAYFPALVMRTGVHTIDTLAMVFDEDLANEELSVAVDGSTTPTNV